MDIETRIVRSLPWQFVGCSEDGELQCFKWGHIYRHYFAGESVTLIPARMVKDSVVHSVGVDGEPLTEVPNLVTGLFLAGYTMPQAPAIAMLKEGANID